MSANSEAHNSIVQSNVFDLQSLGKLKYSKQGDQNALKETAKQFESLFLKQLLSSMRKVNEVFQDEDSLFNSSSINFYQGMLDEQMSSSLASTSAPGGIAQLLMDQFGEKPSNKTYKTSMNLTANPQVPGVVNQRFESLINSAREIAKQVVNDKAVTVENAEMPLFAPLKNTSVAPVAPIKNEPDDFSSPVEFVDFLMPYAKKAASVLGASPQVLLAQAALETGWGKHIINKVTSTNTGEASLKSSKNLFNIKSGKNWQGETATKSTLEFDGSAFKKEQANFRVYEGFTESFEDFVDFISNNQRYQKVVDSVSDDRHFIRALQDSGYATDPDYAKKIERILNSEFLHVEAK